MLKFYIYIDTTKYYRLIIIKATHKENNTHTYTQKNKNSSNSIIYTCLYNATGNSQLIQEQKWMQQAIIDIMYEKKMNYVIRLLKDKKQLWLLLLINGVVSSVYILFNFFKFSYIYI